MTVTHFFDSSEYSPDFVVRFMLSRPDKIVGRVRDWSPEGRRSEKLTDEKYVRRQVELGDLYGFFWEYYHSLGAGQGLDQFAITSESAEADCPTELAEAVLRAIALGLPVKADRCCESVSAVDEAVWDSIGDLERFWLDGVTPGRPGYSGTACSLSKNYLATKVSLGECEYWVRSCGFFTDLMESRGVVRRKDLLNSVSVSGWILDRTPVSL